MSQQIPVLKTVGENLNSKIHKKLLRGSVFCCQWWQKRNVMQMLFRLSVDRHSCFCVYMSLFPSHNSLLKSSQHVLFPYLKFNQVFYMNIQFMIYKIQEHDCKTRQDIYCLCSLVFIHTKAQIMPILQMNCELNCQAQGQIGSVMGRSVR